MHSTGNVYVGVIGGRICSREIGKTAFETGRLIAEQGWILVCGGMGGVMEKACEGSFTSGGITIGILPGNCRKDGNPFLSYSIVTGLAEVRNSIIVKSSNGVIAISGSHGTLSEIAFANLYNIPVVGIDTWELPGPETGERRLNIIKADTPQEAVKLRSHNTVCS
ncbi:hypothetical protein ES708_17361 [subsurface metagenome]